MKKTIGCVLWCLGEVVWWLTRHHCIVWGGQAYFDLTRLAERLGFVPPCPF